MKAARLTAAVILVLVTMLACTAVMAQDSTEVPKAPIMTDFDAALKAAAERDQYVVIDFWRPG